MNNFKDKIKKIRKEISDEELEKIRVKIKKLDKILTNLNSEYNMMYYKNIEIEEEE